jgi:hypothetical protein
VRLYSPATAPRRRSAHRKPPSRRTRRAAVLIALLFAGGTAAAGLLGAGGGQRAVTGAAVLNAKAVTSVSRPPAPDGAASALPRLAAPPARARGPMTARAAEAAKMVRPTSSPAPSGSSASAPPAPSAGPASTAPAASPSPAPPVPSASPPATAPAAGGGSCTSPPFTTSAPFGAENLGSYTVTNDMWNIGGGGIAQTLSVCSAASWSVSATVAADGGGVKTYPDAYYMFARPPAISSLHAVTSTFAQSGPGAGTFEYAYDIWLNGTVGDGNHDEVMIWTENHGQIPGGSPMATATIDGRSYTVWRGTNNLVSFVADTTMTAGTLNLLPFFQWLIGQGWEAAGSALVQVDYGVELVSTNSAPETFSFSDFSVSSS